VVSSTPRPYFTPRKEPVPIVQEAGWAPGPVWMGGKSRPTGIRSLDRPTRSQWLYRLTYPAHIPIHEPCEPTYTPRLGKHTNKRWKYFVTSVTVTQSRCETSKWQIFVQMRRNWDVASVHKRQMFVNHNSCGNAAY
jgi:hypothetical protein